MYIIKYIMYYIKYFKVESKCTSKDKLLHILSIIVMF